MPTGSPDPAVLDPESISVKVHSGSSRNRLRRWSHRMLASPAAPMVLLALFASFSMLAGIMVSWNRPDPGGGREGEELAVRPDRSVPALPPPPAGTPRPRRNVAEAVYQEAQEATLHATSAENFLARWDLLRQWLRELRQRNLRPPFKDVLLANARILFHSDPPRACREVDGLFTRIRDYLVEYPPGPSHGSG